MNRYEQAVEHLEVLALGGTVRIRDGEDTWYCEESQYDAAVAELERQPADDRDEGGAEAYSGLCSRIGKPTASLNGSSRGLPEQIADLLAPWIEDGDDVARALAK